MGMENDSAYDPFLLHREFARPASWNIFKGHQRGLTDADPPPSPSQGSTRPTNPISNAQVKQSIGSNGAERESKPSGIA